MVSIYLVWLAGAGGGRQKFLLVAIVVASVGKNVVFFVLAEACGLSAVKHIACEVVLSQLCQFADVSKNGNIIDAKQ